MYTALENIPVKAKGNTENADGNEDPLLGRVHAARLEYIVPCRLFKFFDDLLGISEFGIQDLLAMKIGLLIGVLAIGILFVVSAVWSLWFDNTWPSENIRLVDSNRNLFFSGNDLNPLLPF